MNVDVFSINSNFCKLFGKLILNKDSGINFIINYLLAKENWIKSIFLDLNPASQ